MFVFERRESSLMEILFQTFDGGFNQSETPKDLIIIITS